MSTVHSLFESLEECSNTNNVRHDQPSHTWQQENYITKLHALFACLIRSLHDTSVFTGKNKYLQQNAFMSLR